MPQRLPWRCRKGRAKARPYLTPATHAHLTLTTHSLIPLAVTGSDGWLETLAADLLRYFRRRLHGGHWADDLAQETLLRLHHALQGGTVENPRALAFRIAENLAIDHHRKQAVRADAAVDWEVAWDDVRCPAPLPDAVVEQRSRLAQLYAALQELPADCRAAFAMSRLEGLSHAEIARRLGVSESMVGKHLARAMRHCRDRLAGQG